MKILTFDIEEWFHVLDNLETNNVSDWNKFPSRIELGMQNIYDILEASNSSATFFVVGWIAKKYPKIVRKISDFGFEVASHSHLHQLAYSQDKKVFFRDVEKSIKTLEDCTGKKVTSFRAPGFSITKENIWAFEILYDLGIKIDCSVFPASRAHGGLPSFKFAIPSIINYNGIRMKEFPINTYSFFGKKIVFSGGGYFRVLPYTIIKNWTHKSNYIMCYFHPRDFDSKQPLIPGLSYKRRFKSYVGIKNCKSKLNHWLSDFKFIDLKTANNNINWQNVPEIYL